IVGKDSVNTDNIVDGAGTYEKRTRLGEKVTVTFGTDFNKKPNIDTVQGNITFYTDFFVVYANNRQTIDATTIDFSNINSAGIFFFFGRDAGDIIAVSQTKLSTGVSENYMFFGALYLNHEKDKVFGAEFSFDYTIDNIPSTQYYLMNTEGFEALNNTISLAPIYSGGTGLLPIYDNDSRKLKFNSAAFIVHGRKRYTIPANTTIDLDVKNAAGVCLFYDYINDEFITKDTRYNDAHYSNILIAISYYQDNYKRSRLLINSDYKETIQDEDSSDKGSNCSFSINRLEGDFPNSKLPGVGDSESPFDYDNDTHDVVYGLYDELMNANPDYITRKEWGRTDTDIPIYEYTFNPPRPSDLNVLKPYPKIIMGASIHGGEGLSVISLYYLMKRICEGWESDKTLEKLRHNFIFSICPIRSPQDYDDKTYVNSNGVNINRNFPYRWEERNDSTKGSEPFSEIESQVQRDIIEANDDAIHHIDIHVRGGRQQVDDDKMLDLRMGLPNEVQAAEETIEQLSRRWREQYPQLPDSFLGKCTYSNTTGATIGGYVRNIVGIPSVTWEGFSKSETMNET